MRSCGTGSSINRPSKPEFDWIDEPWRVASPTVALGIQYVALASPASVYTLMAATGRNSATNRASARARCGTSCSASRVEESAERSRMDFCSWLDNFRLSVRSPGGTTGRPCSLLFYRRFSNVCADSNKGIQGCQRVCPVSLGCQRAGRRYFGNRYQDTGWSGNCKADWKAMHGSAARPFQFHCGRVAAAIA